MYHFNFHQYRYHRLLIDVKQNYYVHVFKCNIYAPIFQPYTIHSYLICVYIVPSPISRIYSVGLHIC